MNGYYKYKEHDATKIIYIFLESDIDGEDERYYYFDLAEKTVRSFSVDNEIFKNRCEEITDLETTKNYALIMEPLIISYENNSRKILEILKTRFS